MNESSGSHPGSRLTSSSGLGDSHESGLKRSQPDAAGSQGGTTGLGAEHLAAPPSPGGTCRVTLYRSHRLSDLIPGGGRQPRQVLLRINGTQSTEVTQVIITPPLSNLTITNSVSPHKDSIPFFLHFSSYRRGGNQTSDKNNQTKTKPRLREVEPYTHLRHHS